MKKSDVVKSLLPESMPGNFAKAFAPANIALCKYWGKRNAELNLPMTSSLSVSLGDKGSTTEIKIIDHPRDSIFLNNVEIDATSSFSVRLRDFLDLFRTTNNYHFHINTYSNIPIAAGLASSASGFASLTLALNQLFHWQLEPKSLSILARLGSGSACRSIWPGFVEWQAGVDADGMDSHGVDLQSNWPELCVGLLIINAQQKAVSSRIAMQSTVSTSALYPLWPEKVSADLKTLKKAIATADFSLLGKTSESNALTMHALMLSAWPPISYFLPETLSCMHKIWEHRQAGLEIFFTQDAGPNLKLLFLKKDLADVKKCFPEIDIIKPFDPY